MSLYVEGQAADDSVPIFMTRKPGTDSAFCNATVLSRFTRDAFETKGKFPALFGEIIVEPEHEDEEEKQEEEEEQEEEEQKEEESEVEEEQEDSDSEGGIFE